jgi:hypothetical protein
MTDFAPEVYDVPGTILKASECCRRRFFQRLCAVTTAAGDADITPQAHGPDRLMCVPASAR